MLKIMTGSIFCSRSLMLVDPICTQAGVMGKGLALEFYNRYPILKAHHFSNYGRVDGERVKIVEVGIERYVALFPTKEHWKNPSKLEYIQKSLDDLELKINNKYRHLNSIAIPKVGCGLGNLLLDDVLPLISSFSERIPLDVELYV